MVAGPRFPRKLEALLLIRWTQSVWHVGPAYLRVTSRCAAFTYQGNAVPWCPRGLMIFTETRLRGVFEIDLEAHEDERGFFARSYCWREFEAHGLNPQIAQCNVSYNRQRGTLRGMHYQEAPDAGSQADSLRSRSAVRRHRRPPDRLADVRQWTAVGIESRAGHDRRECCTCRKASRTAF